jgi:hypothetical protein
MAVVLLKIVDRQENNKDNLFPNNYNNISTSLFAVFAFYNLSGRNSDGAKEEKWGKCG